MSWTLANIEQTNPSGADCYSKRFVTISRRFKECFLRALHPRRLSKIVLGQVWRLSLWSHGLKYRMKLFFWLGMEASNRNQISGVAYYAIDINWFTLLAKHVTYGTTWKHVIVHLNAIFPKPEQSLKDALPSKCRANKLANRWTVCVYCLHVATVIIYAYACIYFTWA